MPANGLTMMRTETRSDPTRFAMVLNRFI